MTTEKRPETRFAHADAYQAGRRLVEFLKREQLVERAAIAGSIRRRRPDVKDIELVVIPRMISQPGQLFDDGRQVSALDEWLSHAIRTKAEGILPDENRGACWGPRFKKFRFFLFPVDLFIVTRPTWAAQLAIRTGPAEFTQHIVTPINQGGAMPSYMKQRHGRLFDGSDYLETRTERDWFAALGLRWMPPTKRSIDQLARYRKPASASSNERTPAPAIA